MEKTYNYITSANGYSAIVFDDVQKRTKMFFPHIYRNIDRDKEVRSILYDTYFGLAYNNESFWLPEREGFYDYIGYLERTGIIRLHGKTNEIETDEYLFSPMTLNGRGMLMLIRVKALADIGELSVFSIHNFHLGLENDNVSYRKERIYYDKSDIFIESSGSAPYITGYKPLIDGTIHSASPVNPYNVVKSGEKLTDVEDSGVTDDAVCGFERDYKSLRAGEEVWFGVLILYEEGKDAGKIIKTAGDFTEGKTVQDYLSDEIRFWEDYFGRLDDDIRELIAGDDMLSKAVVFLKMAQVRESNTESSRPNGQILASLPPGMWNITWIRDMMYSLYALIEIGAREEALGGIKFILNADVGYYKNYVGTDYQFSVCRYYGNGMEESDSNEDGPNIEFDGAGLFLIALAKYVSKFGIDDVKNYVDQVFSGFADVLIYLIDEQGLIRADSSIWERHLNGNEKHFTYTQITALSGLCGAAYLAERVNLTQKLKEYRRGYETLRNNILGKLVHKENFFVSSLEEYKSYSGYLDAAVIEAINFGIVLPDDIIAEKTLNVMKNLRTSGGGYKRNDDGDWYDRQEWVFIDLRIADAMKRVGSDEDALNLIARIRDYTEMNNYQFPELITEDGTSVAGSVPMIGFGAAAYILAAIRADNSFCSPVSVDAGSDYTDISSDEDEISDESFSDRIPDSVSCSDAGEESDDTSSSVSPVSSSCSCSLLD